MIPADELIDDMINCIENQYISEMGEILAMMKEWRGDYE
tara:strand:- start:1305 stop:1421 length:117 start_codon:yes stop_codon:yes gene_type:complete